MQDPLETRLSQLPLRPAPAHWRRAILNRAADVPPRKRLSANWLALAAAWILIGLLQWHSNAPGAPHMKGLTGPIYLPVLSALRTQKAVLEELLAEPLPPPPAPRQSRTILQPSAATV